MCDNKAAVVGATMLMIENHSLVKVNNSPLRQCKRPFRPCFTRVGGFPTIIIIIWLPPFLRTKICDVWRHMQLLSLEKSLLSGSRGLIGLCFWSKWPSQPLLSDQLHLFVNCMRFHRWGLHSRKGHPLHVFFYCFSLITKFRRWKEGNWITPNWQLFET